MPEPYLPDVEFFSPKDYNWNATRALIKKHKTPSGGLHFKLCKDFPSGIMEKYHGFSRLDPEENDTSLIPESFK